MRCRNNLDERQLLQRGNVFQHATIFLIVALGINAFLKGEGIVWAEGIWENILIVWCAITLCFCEFIFLEIYPMGAGQNTFYVILGVTGAAILAFSIYHFAAGEETFFQGNMLSEQGAITIEAGLMLVIFLVFLGRKWYHKRKGADQDEE